MESFFQYWMVPLLDHDHYYSYLDLDSYYRRRSRRNHFSSSGERVALKRCV